MFMIGSYHFFGGFDKSFSEKRPIVTIALRKSNRCETEEKQE